MLVFFFFFLVAVTSYRGGQAVCEWVGCLSPWEVEEKSRVTEKLRDCQQPVHCENGQDRPMKIQGEMAARETAAPPQRP